MAHSVNGTSLNFTPEYSVGIRRNKQFYFSSILFFLFISLVITLKPSVNQEYFYLINGLSQILPDQLVALVSDLGNGAVTACFLFILLCLKPDWTLRVLFAAILCTLLTHLLKNYFDALRPPAQLDQLHIIGKPRHYHSFPSGHTSSIFLLAGIAFQALTQRLWQSIILLLAVCVALSRVSVGAHWPVDIALGAIIGWLSAYYGCLICGKGNMNQGRCMCLMSIIYGLIAIAIFIGNDDFEQYTEVRFAQFTYLIMMTLAFYYWFIKPRFLNKKSRL